MLSTNAGIGLIPIQIPSQYHHGNALYLRMYVVMLTVVEKEGVPLVNMQLVVNIIHKSYRIEAMSPNFFPLWPFKNAHQHCNTVICMYHHLDMHSLQSYMHMHVAL